MGHFLKYNHYSNKQHTVNRLPPTANLAAKISDRNVVKLVYSHDVRELHRAQLAPRDQHQAGDVQEVPGEVSAAGGDQVALPGEDDVAAAAELQEDEGGFDVGGVMASPEEAADAEEGLQYQGHPGPAGAEQQGDGHHPGQLVSGTDDGEESRNIATPKTTRKRKYKSKLEYIEENGLLKNQLKEKDSIIAELRKKISQLEKK